MPFPVAAAIAAGASLGGTFLNNAAQKRINAQSQEFSREMFNLQNQKEVEFWNMQNEYNSPTSMMKRFQDAGLNPNLIYGNGTQTQAAPIHASSAPSWNPKAPQTDLPSAVSAYFDTRIRGAQTDNLKAQNTVLLEEAALKRASTLNTLSQITNRDFDLDVKKQLRQINADYRESELDNLRTRTRSTWDENERRELLTNKSLERTVENIALMRSQRLKNDSERSNVEARLKSILQSNEIQKQEIELRKQGVTSQDELWQRIVAKILSKLGLGLDYMD